MNKRNFLLLIAVLLIVRGSELFYNGLVKAQDEPIRNVVTLTVGCPSEFGEFTIVPLGYTAVYDTGSISSSTNATDFSQFIGYAPDGQARWFQAGVYENYFYVLFDNHPIPNFRHIDNVSWTVTYYDYVETQSVTIDVTRDGNSSCNGGVTPTPSPEPNPPIEPLPTLEIPQVQTVQSVQSTGKVCTISYPSLVVVCQ